MGLRDAWMGTGRERADHLSAVTEPMLFLQGTGDTFAKCELLQPVLDGLGDIATYHPVDGADHGFHVLKRSGRTEDGVMAERARSTSEWATHQVA